MNGTDITIYGESKPHNCGDNYWWGNPNSGICHMYSEESSK